MRKNQKKVLAGVFAVLLAFVAVGGTIAWLTAQDELHNEFTVGSIGKPDEEPKPDQGGDEDEDESGTDWQGGYLFETKWDFDVDHTLNQGVAEDKNPNVGIAAKKTDGSTNNEDYVFLYVDNNSLNEEADAVKANENALAEYAPYFYLENTQWSAVSTESDGSTSAGKVIPVVSTGAPETAPTGHDGKAAYVSGLFMYTKNGSGSALLPVVLSGANAESDAANVYTGELFEDITIPNDLGDYQGKALNVTDIYNLGDDANSVSVYAYIYAADGTETEGGAAAALDSAIKWANDKFFPEQP